MTIRSTGAGGCRLFLLESSLVVSTSAEVADEVNARQLYLTSLHFVQKAGPVSKLASAPHNPSRNARLSLLSSNIRSKPPREHPSATSSALDRSPKMKLILLFLSWALCLAYTRAEPVFRPEPSVSIYGPPSPCSGFQQTNATYFNVSITADASEITRRFASSGLNTSTGYAIVSFALFVDGEQQFPPYPLAPANGASGIPMDLAGTIYIPEQSSANMSGKLTFAKNITAQLWVDAIIPDGQPERTECVQTRLRKEDEIVGESNSTSSTGAGIASDIGNSTSDGNGSVGASDKGFGDSTSGGNDPDGPSAAESGAGVPHIAFSLVV